MEFLFYHEHSPYDPQHLYSSGCAACVMLASKEKVNKERARAREVAASAPAHHGSPCGCAACVKLANKEKGRALARERAQALEEHARAREAAARKPDHDDHQRALRVRERALIAAVPDDDSAFATKLGAQSPKWHKEWLAARVQFTETGAAADLDELASYVTLSSPPLRKDVQPRPPAAPRRDAGPRAVGGNLLPAGVLLTGLSAHLLFTAPITVFTVLTLFPGLILTALAIRLMMKGRAS
jgi:hypothetical protein